MLKKHPAAQRELCIIVSAERAAAGNTTGLVFCVIGALKDLFQQSQQSQQDTQHRRKYSTLGKQVEWSQP